MIHRHRYIYAGYLCVCGKVRPQVRTRTYLRDIEGKLILAWVDNGPGYARASGQGGTLVVGESAEKPRKNWRKAEAPVP